MVEKLSSNGISLLLTHNLPLKNILAIASLAPDNSIFKNKLLTLYEKCQKKLWLWYVQHRKEGCIFQLLLTILFYEPFDHIVALTQRLES